MAKPDSSETVTMTRDDLRKMISEEVSSATKLIAQGAADATVSVRRGLAGIEGQTATQEERTSLEIGKPIPIRKPFKMLIQHCFHPRLGCEFDAHIKVRTHDSDGQEYEKPILIVTEIEITKYPDDLLERCKLPESAKRVQTGGAGKSVKFSDKLDGHWTPIFLQWVYDTYGKPMSAELGSGNDPIYLAPYVVGDPVTRDLGEVRRVLNG